MKTIHVLKANSFCLEKITGTLGIADGGTFASRAWTESDERFDNTLGKKFSWIANNGEEFTDHRDNFMRPTEDQIIGLITRELQDIAIEMGLIQIEITHGSKSKTNEQEKT